MWVIRLIALTVLAGVSWLFISAIKSPTAYDLWRRLRVLLIPLSLIALVILLYPSSRKGEDGMHSDVSSPQTSIKETPNIIQRESTHKVETRGPSPLPFNGGSGCHETTDWSSASSSLSSWYCKSYALLIGMQNYTNGWRPLKWVEDDVRAMEEALKSHNFKVESALNINRFELERRIEAFIERYGWHKDNRLLFYFAGHGHSAELKGTDIKVGYFVPVDAPLPGDRRFQAAAFSLQRVIEYSANILQAKHVL